MAHVVDPRLVYRPVAKPDGPQTPRPADTLIEYPNGFYINGTFRTAEEIRSARWVCLLAGHNWKRTVGPCESVGCGSSSGTHTCRRCGANKMDWSVWRDWAK